MGLQCMCSFVSGFFCPDLFIKSLLNIAIHSFYIDVYYSAPNMYHNLFVHSTTDGRLISFHILTLTNKDVISILICLLSNVGTCFSRSGTAGRERAYF